MPGSYLVMISPLPGRPARPHPAEKEEMKEEDVTRREEEQDDADEKEDQIMLKFLCLVSSALVF